MPKSTPTNAAVATRLIQTRQPAGFVTRAAAAIRLAMHPQTDGNHEQGITSMKAADLRRYAETFGVSLGWLSTGIGPGPKHAG